MFRLLVFYYFKEPLVINLLFLIHFWETPLDQSLPMYMPVLRPLKQTMELIPPVHPANPTLCRCYKEKVVAALAFPLLSDQKLEANLSLHQPLQEWREVALTDFRSDDLDSDPSRLSHFRRSSSSRSSPLPPISKAT